MSLRRCKTPGADYVFIVESATPGNNYHVVRFNIYAPRSRITIDEATARCLQEALHDAAEKVLGKTWIKKPVTGRTHRGPASSPGSATPPGAPAAEADR